jgi:hypothetical protein
MTLTPYEKFESRMVEGNMKRFRGTTRLEEKDGVTRIRYQSEAVPDTVMPLGLARSTIESETREHYVEIAREVMRRKSTPARRAERQQTLLPELQLLAALLHVLGLVSAGSAGTPAPCGRRRCRRTRRTRRSGRAAGRLRGGTLPCRVSSKNTTLGV